MKRSKVDTIFVDEAIRKRKIIVFSVIVAIVSILTLALFSLYINKNKKEYVSYKESSSIDYRVYLKENDFFDEKYLGKDNEYIASLIDYINADFNYNIFLGRNNVDFKYSRRVEAEVTVTDSKGKKPLYNFKEDLIKDKVDHSSNQEEVNIHEKVTIDYNHFNKIVNDFRKEYDLYGVESTLTIKMYVDVEGNCEDLEENPDTASVISLTIPLTEKTMAIEANSDLVENNDSVLVCKNGESLVLVLLLAILMLVVDITLIIGLGVYVVRSRSPRDIYEKELKKILNNYHSFIQKINNDFDLKKFQVLKVDTFTDMLEIRDTLQQPILMVESKDKTGVHFIIPSNTKLLYVYSLKELDIQKRMMKED